MNMTPPQEMMPKDSLPIEPIPPEDKMPAPDARNFVSSYTVDERGILNNFAIMPKMYIEEPVKMTAEEELRARSQAIFAIIMAMMAMMIALLVSW